MKKWTIIPLLILFASGIASAEIKNVKISAIGPSHYTDGSVIPAEKLPNIFYRCYRTDAAGNVQQTLSEQQGTPACGGNVDMTPGSTYFFTMDVVLDGMASDKAPPKSYVFQPTPPPATGQPLAPPTILTMGTDNVLRWNVPSAFVDGSPADLTNLSNLHYYIFARKPDGSWQYVGGINHPEQTYLIPGEWWARNAAAGSANNGIDFPTPTPGSTFTFSVAARHFVGTIEYVSEFSVPISYTFPSDTPPPKPPGVPVILDVVAQIEGKTYTVRLEGTAFPKEEK